MVFRCFSEKTKGDLCLLHLKENQQEKKTAMQRKEKVTVSDEKGNAMVKINITLVLFGSSA